MFATSPLGGPDSAEIVVQMLQSGAEVSPSNPGSIHDGIELAHTALAVGRDGHRRQLLHERLMRTETHFLLDNDLSLIPPLLRELRKNLERMKLCDEIGLLRTTVALSEALTSAIAQGNLEIDPELSEADEGTYQDMIEKRRREQPYADRRVLLIATEMLHEARYMVCHEGPGSALAIPPEGVSPKLMENASTRAYLLLRMLMDEVWYNEQGNEVTLIKRRD